MSNNPYAIKPGEKLLPAEILERYLDWSNHNQSSKAWERKETCDQKLHGSYLCCHDHREISNDSLAFFDYFFHLRMVNRGTGGFSIEGLVILIKEFDIEISEPFLKKLLVYWGVVWDIGVAKLVKEKIKLPNVKILSIEGIKIVAGKPVFVADSNNPNAMDLIS